ncbi:MAG: 5-formyltetrahydrofolate cyclo-ligase [Desulfobulbaceae bacterium]|nr:5-formyltetrahydrofolate cyclo-ligase [Desulfobulbaceae bacterium]
MITQPSDYRDHLRKAILAKRDSLNHDTLNKKSQIISHSLFTHPLVIQALTLFIYVDFRSEVRTQSLIRSFLELSKKVVVPLTLTSENKLLPIRITNPLDQLTPGYCGIPEPMEEIVETQQIDPSTIEIVIAPGSVFDSMGGRLGYGGGYYDRFFVNSAPNALRMGICFEMQMVERVPMQLHDQFMDFIITEKAIYDCKRNRNA